MPRPAVSAKSGTKGSCNTCRHRKLWCDESTPVCGQCAATSRHCDWFEKPTRFREFASSFQRGEGSLNRINPPQDPRRSLTDPKIASLFQHYISDLSTWYDLSDESRSFGVLLPEEALEIPLLFCAIVALSAIHVSKTTSPNMRTTAEFYHACCVKLLVSLEEGHDLILKGSALVATCLLRSYEILDGDVDPYMHLRGAYCMASFQSKLLSIDPHRNVTAGFWNYLREDITLSLFEKCPLKMNLKWAPAITAVTSDHDYLKSLSVIVGQMINSAFDGSMSVDEWKNAYYMLGTWAAGLPIQLKPFSKGAGMNSDMQSFPAVRFLQPCHALTILAEQAPPGHSSLLTGLDPLEYDENCFQADTLQLWALEICGIAFTSKIPSVIVNAFGPIAYCGRYISSPSARQDLIRNVISCKENIGWPIQRLIDRLQLSWKDK